jgi:hypothetical protein
MIPPIGRAGKPPNMGRLSSGYTIGRGLISTSPSSLRMASGRPGRSSCLRRPSSFVRWIVRRKHMK